jgi:hypothetical protein
MERSKILDEVIWTPGWNGQPYTTDNWIIVNSIIPSRKLTKEEMDYMEYKMKECFSDKDNVTIIRKNG